MGLMDIFADPSQFDTLTMGERILGSLITAMMGMGTTFVVLILIWGFIALISRAVRTDEKLFKHEDAGKAAAQAPAPAPAAAAAAAAPAGDDALIAVITAAIAAAQGSAVTSNLIVRKIIRIPGPDPVWSNTGRHEALDSRRV